MTDDILYGSNEKCDFYITDWTKKYESYITRNYEKDGRLLENVLVLEARKKDNGYRLGYIAVDSRTKEGLFEFDDYYTLDSAKFLYLLMTRDKDNIIAMAKERNGTAQKERDFKAKVKAEYDRQMKEYEASVESWRKEHKTGRYPMEPSYDEIYHQMKNGEYADIFNRS